MTDDEIIKALEVHSNEKFDNCEGCPYLEGDFCEGFTKHSKPFRDVLDLINRQQAEIDRYKGVIKILEKDVAEIERLQKANQSFADLGKLYSEIKSEAIKEFADRLKKRYAKYEPYETLYAQYIWHDIDKLVKEMVGDI